MIIGNFIFAAVVVGSTIGSALITKAVTKNKSQTLIEFTEEENVKATYNKEQEILKLRESNRRLLLQLAPVMDNVSYISDENGTLTFYDKENKVIQGKEIVLAEVIDTNDSLDGQVYSYKRLYKNILSDKTSDDVSLFDEEDEVLNIPDSIIMSMQIEQELTEYKEVNDPSKIDGVELPRNGMVRTMKSTKAELEESRVCIGVKQIPNLEKVNSSLYSRYESRVKSTPSQFIVADDDGLLEDTSIYLSEETFNKMSQMYEVPMVAIKMKTEIMSVPFSEIHENFKVVIDKDGIPFYKVKEIDMPSLLSYSIIGLMKDSEDSVSLYEILVPSRMKYNEDEDRYELYIGKK